MASAAPHPLAQKDPLLAAPSSDAPSRQCQAAQATSAAIGETLSHNLTGPPTSPHVAASPSLDPVRHAAVSEPRLTTDSLFGNAPATLSSQAVLSSPVVLLENISLLAGGLHAFEARYGVCLTPETFRRPSATAAAQAVLHFLLVILGTPSSSHTTVRPASSPTATAATASATTAATTAFLSSAFVAGLSPASACTEAAAAAFAHCYPVLDKAQERDFRRAVDTRLAGLERARVLPLGITRKSVAHSAGGDRFQLLVALLSTAALKAVAARNPAHQLVAALAAPSRVLIEQVRGAVTPDVDGWKGMSADRRKGSGAAAGVAQSAQARFLRVRIAAERAVFERTTNSAAEAAEKWKDERLYLQKRVDAYRAHALVLRAIIDEEKRNIAAAAESKDQHARASSFEDDALSLTLKSGLDVGSGDKMPEQLMQDIVNIAEETRAIRTQADELLSPNAQTLHGKSSFVEEKAKEGRPVDIVQLIAKAAHQLHVARAVLDGTLQRPGSEQPVDVRPSPVDSDSSSRGSLKSGERSGDGTPDLEIERDSEDERLILAEQSLCRHQDVLTSATALATEARFATDSATKSSRALLTASPVTVDGSPPPPKDLYAKPGGNTFYCFDASRDLDGTDYEVVRYADESEVDDVLQARSGDEDELSSALSPSAPSSDFARPESGMSCVLSRIAFFDSLETVSEALAAAQAAEDKALMSDEANDGKIHRRDGSFGEDEHQLHGTCKPWAGFGASKSFETELHTYASPEEIKSTPASRLTQSHVLSTKGDAVVVERDPIAQNRLPRRSSARIASSASKGSIVLSPKHSRLKEAKTVRFAELPPSHLANRIAPMTSQLGHGGVSSRGWVLDSDGDSVEPELEGAPGSLVASSLGIPESLLDTASRLHFADGKSALGPVNSDLASDVPKPFWRSARVGAEIIRRETQTQFAEAAVSNAGADGQGSGRAGERKLGRRNTPRHLSRLFLPRTVISPDGKGVKEKNEGVMEGETTEAPLTQNLGALGGACNDSIEVGLADTGQSHAGEQLKRGTPPASTESPVRQESVAPVGRDDGGVAQLPVLPDVQAATVRDAAIGRDGSEENNEAVSEGATPVQTDAEGTPKSSASPATPKSAATRMDGEGIRVRIEGRGGSMSQRKPSLRALQIKRTTSVETVDSPLTSLRNSTWPSTPEILQPTSGSKQRKSKQDDRLVGGLRHIAGRAKSDVVGDARIVSFASPLRDGAASPRQTLVLLSSGDGEDAELVFSARKTTAVRASSDLLRDSRSCSEKSTEQESASSPKEVRSVEIDVKPSPVSRVKALRARLRKLG